jgi:prophage regulatory protein
VTTNNSADKGPEPSDQLLWNIETVIFKTGLSRASIYRYIKRERFPSRRRVGPNRVAWAPDEVMGWIETRPKLGQGRGIRKTRPGTQPRSPRPSAQASLTADAQPSAGLAPWSTSCSPTGTGSNT